MSREEKAALKIVRVLTNELDKETDGAVFLLSLSIEVMLRVQDASPDEIRSRFEICLEKSLTEYAANTLSSI